MTQRQPPPEMPEVRLIGVDDLRAALAAGWRDFAAAPMFGIVVTALYIAGALLIAAPFAHWGRATFSLSALGGFPILGPFAAVALYEVSRLGEAGRRPGWGAVWAVARGQADRRLPWIAVVALVLVLVWGAVAHGIVAQTPGGGRLAWLLAVGLPVGAVFAGVLFALTVVSLPLLLDRDVDLATALFTSVLCCLANPGTMLLWALIVAALLVLGALPGFLGLFVVLPVLGHATWHLYRRVLDP